MREELRKLQGCMKPEVSEDGEDIFHEIALDLANECNDCLDIIIAHQRRETLEECAKLAVARMVYWTEGDGKQSQDFRDGVEQACGDISRALRALLSPAPSTDGTGETKCQHIGAPFHGECPKCDRELP